MYNIYLLRKTIKCQVKHTLGIPLNPCQACTHLLHTHPPKTKQNKKKREFSYYIISGVIGSQIAFKKFI